MGAPTTDIRLHACDCLKSDCLHLHSWCDPAQELAQSLEQSRRDAQLIKQLRMRITALES